MIQNTESQTSITLIDDVLNACLSGGGVFVCWLVGWFSSLVLACWG